MHNQVEKNGFMYSFVSMTHNKIEAHESERYFSDRCVFVGL